MKVRKFFVFVKFFRNYFEFIKFFRKHVDFVKISQNIFFLENQLKFSLLLKFKKKITKIFIFFFFYLLYH